MMFDLKRLLIEELEKDISAKNQMKSEIEKQIETCKENRKKYLYEQTASFYTEEYKKALPKYSKIYTIIHKKKVKEELKEIFNKISKESKEKIDKENENILKLNQELIKINQEIILKSKKMDEVKKANSIQELSLSFEDASEIFNKNNINIFNYNCTEILRFGHSNKTTQNIEFMERAILENPFNIIYDQTNDVKLYEKLLEKINFDDIYNKEIYKKCLFLIKENFKNSINGESFIEPLHLMAAIRFYFNDNLGYNNIDSAIQNSDLIENAISQIAIVINRTLELKESDYKKIEKIFNPIENNYYCHQTGALRLEEKIFKNGLLTSSQSSSDNKRHIALNAKKVDCLLAITGYTNFYGGSGGFGNSRIIIQIPKNIEYIIGSNDISGKQSFILPDFILGSIYNEIENEQPSKKSEFHLNNIQDRKKYPYLFKDHYMPGNEYEALENSSLIGGQKK